MIDNIREQCPRTQGIHRWEMGTAPFSYFCRDCGIQMDSIAKTQPMEAVPVRPSWAETWMTVARAMSQRSYDPRLKVGAIVVSCDNTQMLSVGYNGNYKGGPHEHESPEPGQSGFIHAEVNALVKCDFNFPKKKHMYVTHMPCKSCAKLIINAEISRVVWDVPYRILEGVELLKKVGIEVLTFDEAIQLEWALKEHT